MQKFNFRLSIALSLIILATGCNLFTQPSPHKPDSLAELHKKIGERVTRFITDKSDVPQERGKYRGGDIGTDSMPYYYKSLQLSYPMYTDRLRRGMENLDIAMLKARADSIKERFVTQKLAEESGCRELVISQEKDDCYFISTYQLGGIRDTARHNFQGTCCDAIPVVWKNGEPVLQR